LRLLPRGGTLAAMNRRNAQWILYLFWGPLLIATTVVIVIVLMRLFK
jgi:hypothetical protein